MSEAPQRAAIVGIAGARDLDGAYAPLVQRVVGAAVRRERLIVVGDAPGADTIAIDAARSSGHEPRVFRPLGARTPPALARRSAAMVEAITTGGPGSALIAFVNKPCPAAIAGPSLDTQLCWPGAGSGTWGSIAYGIGLGLAVLVFPCNDTAVLWPAWPGAWRPAASGGIWAAAMRYAPVEQTGLLTPEDEAGLAAPVDRLARFGDDEQRGSARSRRRS